VGFFVIERASLGGSFRWRFEPTSACRCSRVSNRAADVGCRAPPRGVGMPCSFSWAAIVRALVNPGDRGGSPHAALHPRALCQQLDRPPLQAVI